MYGLFNSFNIGQELEYLKIITVSQLSIQLSKLNTHFLFTNINRKPIF